MLLDFLIIFFGVVSFLMTIDPIQSWILKRVGIKKEIFQIITITIGLICVLIFPIFNLWVEFLSQENSKKYYTWSQYDQYGYEGTGPIKTGNEFSKMVSSLLEKNEKGDIVVARCEKEEISTIRKIIEKYPDAPHGYALFAVCADLNGFPEESRRYANMAAEILRITTEIPGHNLAQDVMLKAVNKLIEK